ncbi:Tat pathway signal sequence domain protein [Streptomyces sp. CRN 30]|uniref:Tat pathway signal sequence domain protein n=1 Tax=Streptomyces sp. CRN 30 TaxID=3075613 RepID=UPI002A8070CD|nr:Tat pathway signal sequence domain protein [Streptomyces sp. CRN 30]
MLAGTAAAALLVGGGYLYATHEADPESSALPPSQVVRVTYLGPEYSPPTAPTSSFSFAVKVTAKSGPPVTVTRFSQPYHAISLSTTPRPPFSAKAGSDRKIVITMHVTDCSEVPWNAGFPFLDVTLRNTHAIEKHSFILGERYARGLSRALRAACGDDSRSSPKQVNTPEIIAAHPAGSHYSDRANPPEFRSSTH